MFKLDRLLMTVIIALLNLCNVSSAFTEFLNLLKTVEETRINCVESITKTGVYKYEADPSSSLTACMISLNVPEEAVAFVLPTKKTCETTSSANISAICNRLDHEEHFMTGSHHLRFDASESLTITVKFSPIIRLGCNEYYKNLHTLINSVVIVENDNEQSTHCMIQLPPAVKIQYLDYFSSDPTHCCPDVLAASADLEDNAVSYSSSYSVCNLRTHKYSVKTRCEASYLYLRGALPYDEIMFRVDALDIELAEDCIPDEPVHFADFPCNSKRRKRFRSKRFF